MAYAKHKSLYIYYLYHKTDRVCVFSREAGDARRLNESPVVQTLLKVYGFTLLNAQHGGQQQPGIFKLYPFAHKGARVKPFYRSA